MVTTLLLTSSAALPAPSKTSAQQFDLAIGKGPLSSVLEQFSKQTGLQVGTELTVADSKTHELGPFFAHATADEALAELLKNSALTYTWQDPYTIRIFPLAIQPPRSGDHVQAVLVTGTRLSGDENGPVPIRVYGHRRIERYGVSSVADLSQYLTQQPFAFGADYFSSGAQFFQMRGLGFDTTLVLINGRRMSPSANSISLNAVDLNTVPVSAIDRIEVMSDSASAIYGADAIGGAINLIMKSQIETPEVSVHYGQAEGGGTQRRAAVSIGVADRKRLKSTLVLDFFETDPLMGHTRELWRNQDYRRFGGRDYRVTTTNPGNVYSVTAQPLPGLSSPRAAVPVGTRGALTPADFVATDGATNLDSAFAHWSITPQTHRASAYGRAEYSFGERLSVFVELLAVRGDVTTWGSPPSLNQQFVSASNPFNPFNMPVAVDYSFAGMPPISYLYETELWRLVSGVRGRIREWEWEITGLAHREEGALTVQGDVDLTRVIAAIDSEDPQTALNLFSDGPAGTPELLNSLIAPAQTGHSGFASAQWSAFIRGPLFTVGERKAQLVMGAEWRHDATAFFESTDPIDAERKITSAFTEVSLPLLSQVSLKLAARGDNYGAGESIVNPQYGLTWQPTHHWQLYAAYGTSFRPPALFELYMPTIQRYWLIADPLRDDEVSSVHIIIGGNPDLEVMTAHSFTAGFVFSPADAPNLRVGGNYWRVLMENRILVPSYQGLLETENALVGRVVRDPPSAQDVQEGWAGRVRSIDLRRLNYGDLETSGIDLDASLATERRFGALQLDLGLTWVDEFLSHDMNPRLPLNRVGIANMQGTIPRWRAVGSLAWRRVGFGASTTATLVSSYHDADVSTGPLNRRIDSQMLWDLQAWMELGVEEDGLLDGSIVTVGARNVLDEAPEFANAGTSFGYDASQSELTRRFIYCRLSKRF